ncbi:MAG: nitrile hydratase subunit alpha [Rhodospirillales bacterium]|nr:nitrile hydratase subunit alpha [Rhodospirillales bacterium]
MSETRDHAHSHPFQPDDDAGGQTEHMLLVRAMRELLVEKGVYSAEDERRAIERMDAISPTGGARVVARAWTDPAYKQRLLADGSAAVRELGLEIGPTRLIVVENTGNLHNVIVCTLCSCYPRYVLGIPPAWYKARAYRSRVAVEPRKVLAEFGTDLPDSVEIRVHDSTADMRYMVLPARPAGTGGWDEDALASIVTRDCMIGVSLPLAELEDA